ncbi:MAG: hypothetical protein IJ379_14200 [Lachnospiraceae bacterium]|nr:hypothetical protein [Lachnospiraceae bacterium]MBQ7777064.1 hypothetical protein [Lachnospiraceae bacterium]
MEEADSYPLAQNIEDVLRYQLGSRQKRSLEVYIDNELTTLEDALTRCVEERVVYMPDYILDEKGVLEQLRFDKIDEQ